MKRPTKILNLRLVALTLIAMSSSISEAAPFHRIWRGMKIPELSQTDFEHGVSSRLIPETVRVNGGRGLIAYLPFMSPVDRATLPENFPHEIALVSYASEAEYLAIRATPEGIAYGDLHWQYFVPTISRSLVARPFTGAVEDNQAYDLLQSDADWQRGGAKVSVSAKPADVAAYLESVRAAAPTLGLDSYLVVVGGDYLIEYQLWSSAHSLAALRPAGLRLFVEDRELPARAQPSEAALPAGEGLNSIFPR